MSALAGTDGVVSIASNGLSLTPQYTYDDTLQKQVFTGFQSSVQLTAIVKSDVVCGGVRGRVCVSFFVGSLTRTLRGRNELLTASLLSPFS